MPQLRLRLGSSVSRPIGLLALLLLVVATRSVGVLVLLMLRGGRDDHTASLERRSGGERRAEPVQQWPNRHRKAPGLARRFPVPQHRAAGLRPAALHLVC